MSDDPMDRRCSATNYQFFAEGAHPRAIMERCHSSITVTMDRYGHLFPELDEALTDALDACSRAARGGFRAPKGHVGGTPSWWSCKSKAKQT